MDRATFEATVRQHPQAAAALDAGVWRIGPCGPGCTFAGCEGFRLFYTGAQRTHGQVAPHGPHTLVYRTLDG